MRKYFLMAYFILSVCLCVCEKDLVYLHARMHVKSFVSGTCQSLHSMQNTLITSANV